MAKYVANFEFEGTINLIVEAETLSEAMAKAEDSFRHIVDDDELSASISSYTMEEVRRAITDVNA